MGINTAQNHQGNLSDFLHHYKYQPELTRKLDELPDAPFSQETVNEIVLWKVNRYAGLPEDIRIALHTLRALQPEKHRDGEPVLFRLLKCIGVDLPMAATILRFQAPSVFQIIDRHAYRAVFGKSYPLHSASKPESKVSIYFEYLDRLHCVALSSGAKFCDLDRILYVFDKKQNGKL